MERTRKSLWKKFEICKPLPIIEIAGSNRVLIENHMGILGYSMDEIQIKVSYGSICVTGSNLQLLEISQDQLIIKGQIDKMLLHRR
ncbi:MAG: YabP/YqfC family sporulation protein [Oscillospiraceae bacterium]|nr:YabP/YqfC family sporulation protein [Oscillospiraceae bacterium]